MQTLWSVPVLMISLLAMYFFFNWLRHNDAITGAFQAGLIGAAGFLAFSIPANVAMIGVVFRADLTAKTPAKASGGTHS
jgi:multisubunit Na+/H+ antiporter MnhB subunit